MASDRAQRAETYRKIGYRLWRLSLDRSKDISFEDRSQLATIANGLEELAERVEKETVPD